MSPCRSEWHRTVPVSWSTSTTYTAEPAAAPRATLSPSESTAFAHACLTALASFSTCTTSPLPRLLMSVSGLCPCALIFWDCVAMNEHRTLSWLRSAASPPRSVKRRGSTLPFTRCTICRRFLDFSAAWLRSSGSAWRSTRGRLPIASDSALGSLVGAMNPLGTSLEKLLSKIWRRRFSSPFLWSLMRRMNSRKSRSPLRSTSTWAMSMCRSPMVTV
mmetsp:Transcript_119214/g.319956  ORF Transcript_119214/g.319956 Transcript_119214/m.319956 type:complete len:217 (+) Transcript_119214:1065-1715(+)